MHTCSCGATAKREDQLIHKQKCEYYGKAGRQRKINLAESRRIRSARKEQTYGPRS